nr:hypothetical protein [Tanacetum cinerariifolium]
MAPACLRGTGLVATLLGGVHYANRARSGESTREVWIDTRLGRSPDGAHSPQPHNAASCPDTDTSPATMEKELARAKLICGRAKTAVMTMFSDARMGRSMN